jgi:hypothetical protein
MILTFIKMNVRPEKRKELRQTIQSIVLMWFKRNGHFAKNEFTESEVSHECSKKQTSFHQRIQR